MKPQAYLTENGIRIFNEILKHCKAKGVTEDIYSFELSMLANEFDKYETAAEEAKITGYLNRYPNGTVQVNALHTVMKDAYGLVLKHSSKFGLNPADLEKLGLASKPDKKKEFKL